MAVNWEEFDSELSGCERCRLSKIRKNIVRPVGNRKSLIMFVGGAPEEREDEDGRPFAGAPGIFFDKMLADMGLSRETAYITNIVKCRVPKRRDPLDDEYRACRGFLKTELALISPRIVVCVGRQPSWELMRPDLRITMHHGEWMEKDGVLYTAFMGPSTIMANTAERPRAYVDIAEIKRRLETIKNE